MNRRSFLTGLAATLAAPAIIRTPGLLMPIRPVQKNATNGILWIMGNEMQTVAFSVPEDDTNYDAYRGIRVSDYVWAMNNLNLLRV